MASRGAGIFLCLLIAVLDVTAGILAVEAGIAQNKVKHLKLWISECAEPSHKAFMLGLGAAILLALAHVIVNLLGGFNCLCSAQDDKPSPNRQISMGCLILTWIVLAVGLGLLVIGTSSNNKSGGSHTITSCPLVAFYVLFMPYSVLCITFLPLSLLISD